MVVRAFLGLLEGGLLPWYRLLLSPEAAQAHL